MPAKNHMPLSILSTLNAHGNQILGPHRLGPAMASSLGQWQVHAERQGHLRGPERFHHVLQLCRRMEVNEHAANRVLARRPRKFGRGLS